MKKINIVLPLAFCAGVGLVACAHAAGSFIPFCQDVTIEKYPDADSVLINEIDRVKYNPEGTYDEVAESWTKVLTEKGRREESSVSLRYSKRYGKTELLYVGVIDANDVERVIDFKATTRDMTDNSSMGANIYDPLDRRAVTTIPGA